MDLVQILLQVALLDVAAKGIFWSHRFGDGSSSGFVEHGEGLAAKFFFDNVHTHIL